MRLLLHPDAEGACERGHAFSHDCNQVFCGGNICGRIHVSLLWLGYEWSSCRHHRSIITGGSPFLTTLACTRTTQRLAHHPLPRRAAYEIAKTPTISRAEGGRAHARVVLRGVYLSLEVAKGAI